MDEVPDPRAIVRFGEFELDPANHALTRNGVAIKLAPQPFKILFVLVQRPGALVTREALRQAVWGDETVVDFEHGLNTCVRQIRRALEDDADSPRFVQTLPRVGYRLTAPITRVPRADARLRRAGIVAAAISVVAIALTATWMLQSRKQSEAARSTEAHDLYLRGRLALDERTAETSRTALELFNQALAVDPRYAPAEAGVAWVYLQKPSSIPGIPPNIAAARAQHAIDLALALDQSLPEAHLAAAELEMTRHDWSAAGREYRRAIEIAPRDSIARQEYALWLSYQARFDEALEAAHIAESLDPLSPSARNSVAEVLRHARRFDEAVAQAQRALQLNPNFGRAHAVLGHCYLAQGKFDPAIEEHRRSGHSAGNLGYAYAVAGRTDEARVILDTVEKRYVSTHGGAGEIAQMYIGLYEFDKAFEWLERAVDDGSVWTLKVAVVWDPLRSDPRFEHLLRKAGFNN